MAFDAHANFAYGTVLTAPSPATTGTSLTLNSGQGANFPTPPFNVTIWPASVIPSVTNAEIARVTGVSGDVLTITRHTESTSARSVGVGDQVALAVTAKLLTDIEAILTGTATIAEAAITNLVSDLAAKASLASPTFSGTPSLPTGTTGVTQSASDNSTKLATTAYADAIAALKANLNSPTFTGTPSLPTGATGVTQSAGDNSTKFATTAYVDAKERGFTMGKGGVIGATETNAADFPFCVPYAFTIKRMKVTLQGACSGAMTVQLRKATATITTPPTYSDVSGFVCTFSSGNVLAVVDPADAAVAEGDFLNFSCATGSGTNLLVELIGV